MRYLLTIDIVLVLIIWAIFVMVVGATLQLVMPLTLADMENATTEHEV